VPTYLNGSLGHIFVLKFRNQFENIQNISQIFFRQFVALVSGICGQIFHKIFDFVLTSRRRLKVFPANSTCFAE
jgi:hypothetical protein